MDIWLVENQVYCRLVAFAIFFVLLALWEKKRAAWPWFERRRVRWLRNISLSLISKIAIRLMFPFLSLSVAWLSVQKGIGYFNINPKPLILEIAASILLFDFVMYFQHQMMHRIQLLWLVHRVHHMDRQLDLSTGLRFHPFEEIFTMGLKLLVIAFIGAPIVAVLIYEIGLNAMTMFVHMNIHLSTKRDRILRWFIVTPNMHRIHHSDYFKETNSNYGFCFSIWDRLFGSYTPRPITGEFKISIGLEEYRDPKYQILENMLLVPFNLKKLKVRPKKRVPSRMV